MDKTRRYRSIWLSDTHLGTRGCKADFLLDFLTSCESDYLYLVGDIIDGWQLRKSWYWDQHHNDVIQSLLSKTHAGTRVTYVPGNHDEFARNYFGLMFGGITIRERVVHKMNDGRRFLVMHGDEFDGVVRYAKWLAVLGDAAYQLALLLNNGFNMIRRRLGYPYWSLSAWLKHKVKNAIQYIDDFEKAVAREATLQRVDGIICGHIHKADIKAIDGILYCNDGDWVESCTALVETLEGQLEIVHWTDTQHTVVSIDSARNAAAAA
jgi:UDP-2,3-diacylglucosamine pyrophosphatase LpxH